MEFLGLYLQKIYLFSFPSWCTCWFDYYLWYQDVKNVIKEFHLFFISYSFFCNSFFQLVYISSCFQTFTYTFFLTLLYISVYFKKHFVTNFEIFYYQCLSPIKSQLHLYKSLWKFIVNHFKHSSSTCNCKYAFNKFNFEKIFSIDFHKNPLQTW